MHPAISEFLAAHVDTPTPGLPAALSHTAATLATKTKASIPKAVKYTAPAVASAEASAATAATRTTA